jgi:hypothetical protein
MDLKKLPKLLEKYSKRHNFGELCHVVIYDDSSGDIYKLIEKNGKFDSKKLIDSFKTIDELIEKLKN